MIIRESEFPRPNMKIRAEFGSIIRGGEDYHQVAYGNHVKQFDHVGIAEADATMACGLSEQVFAVRSVDIDAALQGVRVCGIQTLKTENPGENQIILRSPHPVARAPREPGT